MLDFLGIGAQKAGTSWLYAQLSRHPRIAFPAGKELHYWDHREQGRHQRDTDWYLARFAGDAATRKGEITPAYATLPMPVVREIYRLNNQLRLIFVLRNPIERAWSAALMALRRAQMSPEEASDRWFLDLFRSRASFARGDYEPTLRRWHEVFGREALLLLFFEDLCTGPRGLLRACAEHLTVEPEVFEAVPDADLRQPVFEGAGTPLRPSLRPPLTQLYRERVERLAAYLDRDLGHWLVADQCYRESRRNPDRSS